MRGYVACNYKCTDGLTRSFVTESGGGPRVLSARDKRLNWNRFPLLGDPGWLFGNPGGEPNFE